MLRWLGELLARLLPRTVVRGALLRVWREVGPEDEEVADRVSFVGVARQFRRGTRRPIAGIVRCRVPCPHCGGDLSVDAGAGALTQWVPPEPDCEDDCED